MLLKQKFFIWMSESKMQLFPTKFWANFFTIFSRVVKNFFYDKFCRAYIFGYVISTDF